FEQLLEMDDEDEKFSQGVVFNYFDQAKDTFKEMDEALTKKDLPRLSRLGHYLKGSSAAIGLKKLVVTFEKIQHTGNLKKDSSSSNSLKEDEAIKMLKDLLEQAKTQFKETEDVLTEFY
ncbi:signal transduction histidine kinase, partial [Paraphysoderma sedebokerense]